MFLVVLVRTAWISDDALISLRTVLNVTNGFGLTFNIAQRRPCRCRSGATADFDDSAHKPSGIVDERGVYFGDKSLVRAKRATFKSPNWPSASWQAPVTRVVETCGLIGVAGLDLGPYVHLLDDCALADPLLARLPALYNPEWRPGVRGPGRQSTHSRLAAGVPRH